MPAGPLVVVVSLTEQRAYVYRNGIRVGVSSVSSWKPGHQTPTDIFTILQKDEDHHSSKYNDAAMPYTERLQLRRARAAQPQLAGAGATQTSDGGTTGGGGRHRGGKRG